MHRFFLAALAATLLAGCQIPLGAPVASMDNVERARASLAGPVALGEFSVEAGRDPALDRGPTVRGAQVESPVQGSFAQYLRETLSVELKAANLLDAASSTVIHGYLTDSQLDAGISQGRGGVAARFVVKRAGRTLYEREHRADLQWPSSFIGAVAVPDAMNQYAQLYRVLVGRLLSDPAFRAALRS